MYQVYLVDDEPLVLADMMSSIPWNEYNLTVVGSQTDPRKAMDEILSLRPEAVFTDLKMPAMGGIELIAALRAAGADMQFVVISAHEKFSYARDLMRLEAIDYLIKPVQHKQYEETLQRLSRRLAERYPHKDLPQTASLELNKIILYLNQEIDKKHTLKEISQKFSLTANYICHLFSKHMQTTFSSYVTSIRMERAGRLLRSSDQQVKEIAVSCGYDDYFYFCRVFKDVYHMTPTQYRGKT